MSDGLLAKVTILPFDDPETVQAGPPVGPPFVAQFNPETLEVATKLRLGPEEQAQGDEGSEAKFESIEPRTFSFDFLLDGTGASGESLDVLAQVELFKATTGFCGDIHRPFFLVISWGTFLATCVLEGYTVKYELFRPSGTPLRAVLSASFREHTSNPLKQLVMNLCSPDVMHAHDVVGGEHLSLITHRVYDDTRYVVPVAEANGLDTIRRVEPGTTVYLPPLA